MAQLKDTTVTGSLGVTGTINLGNASLYEDGNNYLHSNKSISIDQGKVIYGADSEGKVYNALTPLSSNGNTLVGLGVYNEGTGNTCIYGNDVTIYCKKAGEQNVRLYYRAGDKISFTLRTAGFITGSKKTLLFTVPLNRPVLGSPTVTAASTNGFLLRQNGNYTSGTTSSTSSGNTYCKPSAYSAALYSTYVHIQATLSDTTNVTNNDTIGIQWEGTITFS